MSDGRERQAPFRFNEFDLAHRYVNVEKEEKVEHHVRNVVNQALPRVLQVVDEVFFAILIRFFCFWVLLLRSAVVFFVFEANFSF